MEPVVIAMPEMGNNLFRKYMKSKYVQSLARAGAETKWIDLSDPKTAAREAALCDGLLLPGGADIEPALYGQSRSEKCGKPNLVRDAAEPMILETFLETGKPIFGICRGIQLLNVYFGGTLLQDIKDIQKYKHSDFLSRAHSTHPVQIEQDSKLYSILGAHAIQVNSIHHQAVDQIGRGLRSNAVSADGFTEGLELSAHRFCMAVQWHPEHMSRQSAQQRLLFDAFVTACRE